NDVPCAQALIICAAFAPVATCTSTPPGSRGGGIAASCCCGGGCTLYVLLTTCCCCIWQPFLQPPRTWARSESASVGSEVLRMFVRKSTQRATGAHGRFRNVAAEATPPRGLRGQPRGDVSPRY